MKSSARLTSTSASKQKSSASRSVLSFNDSDKKKRYSVFEKYNRALLNQSPGYNQNDPYTSPAKVSGLPNIFKTPQKQNHQEEASKLSTSMSMLSKSTSKYIDRTIPVFG
jgi:hypothetical protein